MFLSQYVGMAFVYKRISVFNFCACYISSKQKTESIFSIQSSLQISNHVL